MFFQFSTHRLSTWPHSVRTSLRVFPSVSAAGARRALARVTAWPLSVLSVATLCWAALRTSCLLPRLSQKSLCGTRRVCLELTVSLGDTGERVVCAVPLPSETLGCTAEPLRLCAVQGGSTTSDTWCPNSTASRSSKCLFGSLDESWSELTEAINNFL